MEQIKQSQKQIELSMQQIEINTPSTKEDKIKKGLIRPYNYKCQQDQYNVKLSGIVFDAIGAPDFFNDSLIFIDVSILKNFRKVWFVWIECYWLLESPSKREKR